MGIESFRQSNYSTNSINSFNDYTQRVQDINDRILATQQEWAERRQQEAEARTQRLDEFYKKLEETRKENKKKAEELAERRKQEHSNIAKNRASSINGDCNGRWLTKYAIDDISSLEYYLSCNPDCDSSVHSLVAGLKTQRDSSLVPQLNAYLQGKDTDSTKLEMDLKKVGIVENPIKGIGTTLNHTA